MTTYHYRNTDPYADHVVQMYRPVDTGDGVRAVPDPPILVPAGGDITTDMPLTGNIFQLIEDGT